MTDTTKPVTDQEALYDAEIAPALLAIGQRCQELGIPFVAVVEYKPGETGHTHYMPDEACIAMQIAHRGAASHGNFDGVCISLLRYLHLHGYRRQRQHVPQAARHGLNPIPCRRT